MNNINAKFHFDGCNQITDADGYRDIEEILQAYGNVLKLMLASDKLESFDGGSIEGIDVPSFDALPLVCGELEGIFFISDHQAYTMLDGVVTEVFVEDFPKLRQQVLGELPEAVA